MGFQLNAEQQQIQKAVRDFVKVEFDKQLIMELESKHKYPVGIWKKAADLGFVGIHFPKKQSLKNPYPSDFILILLPLTPVVQYIFNNQDILSRNLQT